MQAQPVAVSISRFHTDSLPAGERFSYLADEILGQVGSVEIDSPDRANFHQEILTVTTGSVGFMRGKGSPIRSCGRPLGAEPETGHPFLLARKMGDGPTQYVQGREAIIEPGGMVLLDTARQYTVGSEYASNSLFLALPLASVRRWIPRPEDLVAHRIESDKGWGAMLSNYLEALDLDQVQALSQGGQQSLISEHVLSMLSFSLVQSHGVKETEVLSPRDMARHGLHERMREWVRESYADLDLNAARVAAQFHVSVRYVHKAFACGPAGSSFLETLTQERLRAAERLLQSPSNAGISIAEIGDLAGFGNPIHFGRLFRKHKGVSPGAYREQRRHQVH